MLIALCVLISNASRQDAAERQVQQVAQLQRSILDSAGPMILATDLEGNLLIFNPAAERMFGYRVTRSWASSAPTTSSPKANWSA